MDTLDSMPHILGWSRLDYHHLPFDIICKEANRFYNHHPLGLEDRVNVH